jgi:hypothetical protein
MPNPETGGQIKTYLTEPQFEEIEELEEKYDFASRAALLRHLLQLGMNSMLQNDPRQVNESRESEEAVTIRELVPEGKEDAISINRGDEENLIDEIDEQILEIVQQDPEIHLDGWKVYR